MLRLWDSQKIGKWNRFGKHKKKNIPKELYDQMLGKDVVKSEEEFRQFIANDIKKNFDSEAEYQFTQDLRSYLLNRIGEVEFAA